MFENIVFPLYNSGCLAFTDYSSYQALKHPRMPTLQYSQYQGPLHCTALHCTGWAEIRQQFEWRYGSVGEM